ncbi:hypothetical protein CC_0866 [Caulobacter vibrioides CB15]|uniref:Uncharacterized protein n=1 Tax=Caulobacter vibrioides (strain ATCC 19089 / CIP 103742 / CB 15) TaxID=190650 RepID=Q9A9U5_CAUVC|nr:hypothetical protein CC_0866 [Caulobacter vibrioides CB15]ATC27706.1 hypothetical protein CA607_04595 [Caulobacter vibrioides]
MARLRRSRYSDGMMLPLLLLALAAASPSPRDAAGNQLEPLKPAAEQAARLCTGDQRWCAGIDDDSATLSVFTGPTGAAVASVELEQDEDETLAVWPQMARLAAPGAGVLIGVERRRSASYSGGGGGTTVLELIQVWPDRSRPPRSVLTLPLKGEIMIRACFSKQDFADRKGACQDIYTFDATLTLAPETASGPPKFQFATLAKAFPPKASRGTPTPSLKRLKKSELVPTPDLACSYRRVLAFDPKSQTYRPDSPLPDCDDYTTP